MSDTPTDTHSDESIDREDRDRDRDPDVTRDVLNTDVMQWVSALAALIGLWIVASPFVFEATDQAYWNNTLVGTGIFLLAGYNFVRMTRDRLANVGVAALATLLGLWTAISPFLIEMGSDNLATSTIASGALVALLSAYNAYENSKADVPERRRMRA